MLPSAHLQGPAEVTPAWVWLVGYVNVSHEMDSNLNISPKMSYGVLEYDSDVTELHAYDFVIKDIVRKQGALFVPDPVV